MGDAFVESLLLKAVKSNTKVPDTFIELDDTWNYAVDIEALMKLYMVIKSSLAAKYH